MNCHWQQRRGDNGAGAHSNLYLIVEVNGNNKVDALIVLAKQAAAGQLADKGDSIPYRLTQDDVDFIWSLGFTPIRAEALAGMNPKLL